MEQRFCSLCGSQVSYIVPAGDQRLRAVCSACGQIHYQNPQVVVGAVAFWQDRLLLCRRAIPPRVGYWTFPAGYLELEETTEEGACREAFEEAGAELEIEALLAVYNLSHISQVQIIYLAQLRHPHIYAGEESLEVGLFDWSEIPWDALAFPTNHRALQHARAMCQHKHLPPERRSRDLKMDADLLY
ncbi:MAG: NUDIX hydrolase [Candidatus Sericytochromatia bacterium]|nr:NUDIX hydrolase [Candidatus Sericytochromatia bacterium]